MTPNVIKAKIKRLEARRPSLEFWINYKQDDEFKRWQNEIFNFLKRK